MIRVHRAVCGPLENNVYLVWDEDTREVALIDPGIGSEGFTDFVRREGLKPKYILNTHAHFDHTWSNAFFKREWGVSLVCPRGDESILKHSSDAALSFGFNAPQASPAADIWCQGGDEFFLGSERIEVLDTPGHTPGHVSFLTAAGVFCGDVLFNGGVGRWDLPGGDGKLLLASIRETLFALPDPTPVFPGHGSPTSIGEEKRSNPYVGEGAVFEL